MLHPPDGVSNSEEIGNSFSHPWEINGGRRDLLVTYVEEKELMPGARCATEPCRPSPPFAGMGHVPF